MKRLYPFIVAILLVGCNREQHSYTGTIADADRDLVAAPMGLTHLAVEARGDTWVRYHIIHESSGIYITNGTAGIRVEYGQIGILGPADVRRMIREALKLK
jgi:hypothetical protein